MNGNWLAMEHYRLHVVENWPDRPAKDAALAAIQSTMASLLRIRPAEGLEFECCICGASHAATLRKAA